MCRTTAYKSTACNHRWLTITTRCAPNVGFTTTPVHEFRSDTSFHWGRPSYLKAPTGACPNCDLKGQYDGNTTRMVLASGSREIQRNLWRMGHAGPAQNADVWSLGCRGYETSAVGACQYPQRPIVNGHVDPNLRYYPVAQEYAYGYGRRRVPGPSGCDIM